VTTFPGSPRLLKGGIVLLDPDRGTVVSVIALQYNPDTLTRNLQVQAVGEAGDRSDALRLKGPPVETMKVDVEIDAADQLEHPRENPDVVTLGIHPQIAVLESLVYPPSARLLANDALARLGTLEIAPPESPQAVFVWSRHRILPVRVTDLSVTEEAFDPSLNPLRAKVSLGLRVLSVTDLGFARKGGNLFVAYHQRLESLARRVPQAGLAAVGVGAI
jgi:hypothetical protein